MSPYSGTQDWLGRANLHWMFPKRTSGWNFTAKTLINCKVLIKLENFSFTMFFFFSFQGMRFLWSQGLSSSEFPKTWVRLKKKEKTKYYANLYLNYWSPVFHWYFHQLRTYLHTVDHLKFRKVIYDTNSIRYFWAYPGSCHLIHHYQIFSLKLKVLS